MKAFTLKTEIVSVDKSSKQIDRIRQSYAKMAQTVNIESKIAGNSFSQLTNRIGIGAKKALVSMNTMNASINRVFRGISQKLGSLGLFVGFAAIATGVKSVIDKMADFEQANAGLAAVMGVTVQQNKALSDDAKRLGAITAKSATEVVGLQEAYARLGFVQQDILNMTESTIAGSVAMNGELDQTAELVGAMVKSFDQFESINAPEIIDQLTKSTQTSALNFEKLQTGLPIVAGAANAAKVSFTKLLASQGKLADAGIDASSASTALRNIFLEAAKLGVPYERLLVKVAKSTDQLATANELFGKRGAVAAVILAKNMDAVDKLDKSLQNAGGTAQTAAEKQLNTLTGTITILKSAWEGWILSLDDGNGKFTEFLKTSIKVATEILSIATGTEKAASQLNEAELRIRRLAERGLFLVKVIKWLVIGFIAFKTILITTRIAITAWNIVAGVQAALFGTLTKSIVLNTTALNAYKVTSGLATVATKLFTKSLLGIPLLAIITGLTLLIAKYFKSQKRLKELNNEQQTFIDKLRETNDLIKEIAGTKVKFENLDLLTKSQKESLKSDLEMQLEKLRNLQTETNIALRNNKEYQKLLDIKKEIKKQESEGGLKDFTLLNKQRSQEKKSIEEFKKLSGGFGILELDKQIKSIENQIEIINKQDKLTSALNDNTTELEKNTASNIEGWKGKFYTSILRDANISESTSRIANAAILSETNTPVSGIMASNNIPQSVVTNNIPQSVVTNNIPQSVVTNNVTQKGSTKMQSGTLTINVVDKTGSRFGIQVEGTGLNVVTTGNYD